MAGRNTKYTPETIKKITDAIALGSTYEHACLYAGIHYATFFEWMKRPEFSDAVRDAEARAVIGWLAKIEKAANDGNWSAASWKLERRFPEHYGRKSTERTVNIQITADDLSKMTDEQLDDLIRRFDPSAR